jgi:hypothetical protein
MASNDFLNKKPSQVIFPVKGLVALPFAGLLFCGGYNFNRATKWH